MSQTSEVYPQELSYIDITLKVILQYNKIWRLAITGDQRTGFWTIADDYLLPCSLLSLLPLPKAGVTNPPTQETPDTTWVQDLISGFMDINGPVSVFLREHFFLIVVIEFD